jgi:hypothetical protein
MAIQMVTINKAGHKPREIEARGTMMPPKSAIIIQSKAPISWPEYEDGRVTGELVAAGIVRELPVGRLPPAPVSFCTSAFTAYDTRMPQELVVREQLNNPADQLLLSF